jgi:hypothetical protein
MPVEFFKYYRKQSFCIKSLLAHSGWHLFQWRRKVEMNIFSREWCEAYFLTFFNNIT